MATFTVGFQIGFVIVRGAFLRTVIQLYISLLGLHPSFKAYITGFLVFLSLWSFSMFFKVDSFIAGASKTQEDALYVFIIKIRNMQWE